MLKLIPSNAPRFVPCPGSVSLEAPFPRSPAHPVTAEGIALHWAVETVLRSWIDGSPETLDLKNFLNCACPENGVIVTEEMIWAGGIYTASIWARCWPYPAGLCVEAPVDLAQWVPGMRGRADVIWRSEDRSKLCVLDLKFGYGPKAAFENWQMLSYVLGAIDDHTQEIEIVIVQPRGTSASDPVKTWTLTVDEFWVYARTLVDAAVEARSPAPRTVAGSHCRYCKAAAHCTTLRAAGMNAFDIGSAAIGAELSETEIAHELELLDRGKELVRARLDALEALAIARIQTGHPVPGFAHKKSLGNRTWTMPARQVIEMGGMFDVDIEERKPLSPNQAEGRGLPREVIDKFTTRYELAAKLTRVDRNTAREIFRT